jgi:hypothetical protein
VQNSNLISLIFLLFLSLGLHAADDESVVYIGDELPVVGLIQNTSVNGQIKPVFSNTLFICDSIEVSISGTFTGEVSHQKTATAAKEKAVLYVLEGTPFVGSGYFETVRVTAKSAKQADKLRRPQQKSTVSQEIKETKVENKQPHHPHSPSSPLPPKKDSPNQYFSFTHTFNLQREHQSTAKYAIADLSQIQSNTTLKVVSTRQLKPSGLCAHFINARPPPAV